MATRIFQLSLLLILITSCRSSAPRTEPEPVSPEISPPTLPSRPLSPRDSWLLQPADQRYRYKSSTISTVVMEQPAASQRDSTLLTASFTVSITRDDQGASYSATVESLSLKAASRASSSLTADLQSPVSFTGHFESGRGLLTTPVDCNNQVSAVLPVIRRSLVIVPLQLRRGQTWADSTSSMACSGSIPVTLTVLQSYQVMGETTNGARSGILLERTDKTTSNGEGTDGQHRVQLKSEGSGQTQLLIDPLTGALLEATGVNTTTAIVTTSGRSQRFTQTSREHVSRDN